MHRPPRRLLALLALVLVGPSCRTEGPPPIDLEASRQARAEQLEQLLGEPLSPLAVADAHYLSKGEALELSDACAVVSERGAVRVGWPAGSLTCERGCGDQARVIAGSVRVDLDGCHLNLSLQSGQGRVLVHRPEKLRARSADQLPHHPVVPEWIIPARFVAAREAADVPFATTRGASKALPLAGHLVFRWEGGEHRLAAFGSKDEHGGLAAFVPFRDRSTGKDSYPVGRYVNVDVAPGRSWVLLDLNQAYNPYCAYSEHYNCPIPPAENTLPFEVRAGERFLAEDAAH